MPRYMIRGVDVDFPFEAYDCQIVYMEKVIQSLQEGCNALLESPTGTGKTLCLLCATLAWRRSLGPFASEWDVGMSSQNSDNLSSSQCRSSYPVIIYTSRTHSQLKQVIRELKASNYRPKMGILGSREQMCIDEDVRMLRGRAQNNACHYLCKKRSCRHHIRVSDFVKSHPKLGNEPFDIEDLVNIGKASGPCPYYVSRELHKVVDILFAPYNYLIDPGKRDSLLGIRWNDAILIFDEAHNLESICADAASFDLPSFYLTACISEAKQCVSVSIKRRTIDKSADTENDPDNYAILGALLMKLEKRISEVSIDSKELGFTRPGLYIYEFLADLNITYETANMLMNTIDKASELLQDRDMIGSGNRMKSTTWRLESIRDILKIIFRDGGKSHAKFYRFHVQESRQNVIDSTKGNASRILSWWCFNPGIAMKEFEALSVRSIILTSGTLSPLDSFAFEMNLKFPVMLENPHVISPNQVWVGILPTGPSGCLLNSSFRNRDSLAYKQELGNAIVNFSRIVPDGLLVFFPSYYLMDQCIECWKSTSHANSTDLNTIWNRICKNKQPVVEPKQSSLFGQAIEDFQAKLHDKSTSGAVFFAVCRGKVSEGLDFADHAGRAVIITGMPFATMTDPKLTGRAIKPLVRFPPTNQIRLKREFLDQQAFSQKDQKMLTGEEWYVQQASRAVNQAVGRVIRHRHDYGAIIFCDERFVHQSRQNQMSFWLRPHVKAYTKFGDVVFTLTRFFRDQLSSNQLKPKLEDIQCDNICGAKISNNHGNLTTFQDTEMRIVGVNNSTKPTLSMVAAPGGTFFVSPEEILPANRSTLRYSVTNQVFKKSEGSERYQNVPFKRKNLDSEDCDVVNLADNYSPFKNKSRTKDMKAPLFSNKHKMCQADQHLLQACGYEASLKKQQTEISPRSSLLSHALGCSTYSSKEHGSSSNSASKGTCYQTNIETVSGDDLMGRSIVEAPSQSKDVTLTTTNEQTRGSVFLLQVQEKLTDSEYQEFVSLMKALKSKAMKIKPVLESIARLFSGPGRQSLLHGFKDYVPPKCRLFYERHINTITTLGD